MCSESEVHSEDLVEQMAVRRRLGRWKDDTIPHSGWSCLETEDLGGAGPLCQMCGLQKIRFVHMMQHPDYPEVLACGRICAGHMEGNLARATERDREMRARARAVDAPETPAPMRPLPPPPPPSPPPAALRPGFPAPRAPSRPPQREEEIEVAEVNWEQNNNGNYLATVGDYQLTVFLKRGYSNRWSTLVACNWCGMRRWANSMYADVGSAQRASEALYEQFSSLHQCQAAETW